MTYKILGYWVSEERAVLEDFVQNVREWYDLLDQMREPITKTIANLDQDWEPRWASYWQQVTKDLGPLRVATRGCLLIFAREQSCQTLPVPLVLAPTAIAYTSSLHTLEAEIKEAGLLITAYIKVSDSQQEKHLRQRQGVLKALRAVDSAAREAVLNGRAELDQAPHEQQKLLTSRRTHHQKQEETPTMLPTDEALSAKQPMLHVVHEEREQ